MRAVAFVRAVSVEKTNTLHRNTTRQSNLTLGLAWVRITLWTLDFIFGKRSLRSLGIGVRLATTYLGEPNTSRIYQARKQASIRLDFYAVV